MSKAVKATIKKELRGILRDKKSLTMMILTPLMIPLFIFLLSYLYDGMLKDTDPTKYQIGINYTMTEVEETLSKDMSFETTYYKSEEEMQEAFKKNNIDAYVIRTDGKYVIYANNKGEDSLQAKNSFTTYLDTYNEYLAKNYLTNIGVDLDHVYNNVSYEFEELQGSNDLVNVIISLGFVFAIMSIALTAIYCATDLTAGEKERGTLETFLTFPMKSEELILGKFLSIFISCVITSLICIIFTVVSLNISGNIFEIYKDTALNFNFVTVSIGLLIMIAFSMFVSGVCIAIASLAKSYKEAQSTLTPVSFVTLIPTFFELAGIGMSPTLAFVPVVNHIMLLKILFCSTMQRADYINIAIMFVTTIVYSIIFIKLITKQYKSEKVLFSI